MDDEIKSSILTTRKEILTKVKQKIDDVLNPSKPTYDPHATPIHILSEIDITEQDYINGLYQYLQILSMNCT